MTAALKPLGLTHVQFIMLGSIWWLRTRGITPSQAEVAAHAGTDAMMTSQVVRALEARGLVQRRFDPSDGRVRRLQLTTKGRRLAEKSVAIAEEVDRTFFAEYDGDALAELLRTLACREPDGRPQP